MSDIAIRVENLSKLYKIGRAQQRHDTLRDALVDAGSRLGGAFRHNGTNSHSDEDLWTLKDVSFKTQAYNNNLCSARGRN